MLALLAIICTGGVKAQTVVFQETFDKLSSTGGNDGNWQTYVGGNELSYNDSKLDNVWGKLSKIYPCNKCVKFASNSAGGKATTSVIKATGDFVLSFKAGALKGKNATLTISVSDGTLAAKSFALTAEKFVDYSVKITGVTKDFTITFSVPQYQQSLLDEIKVVAVEDNRADAGIRFEKDSYTADINKDEFSGAVLVNPNSLKVTYSINPNDATALIDEESGLVTYTKGVEASYEVTAKFLGNETYKPATATYTLNIEDPNYVTQTVTFDATVDKGTNSNTNKIDADKLSKNGITIYGERSLFGNGNNYRFYKAVKGNTAKTTISVDKGNIVKIEFTNNNETSLNKLVFNNGYTYDTETKNSVWVGKSNSISFTTDDATVSATKITVTVKVPKDFTLDEKEVNEIEDWENSNVTVKRTFYKDGDWNTLCLPFDVSAEEVKAAFGSDAQLRQVDEDNSKDNTVAFTTATAIKAGVPYLIKFDKLAENADQPQEFNHTFEGVTLTKKVEYSVLADFNIIFAGSYSAFTPEDFLKEYNTCNVVASMAAANTLKKVNVGTTIKGLRAVFGLNSSVQPQAVKVIIDGTATGIGDLHVDGTTVANGRVYNLNGQCVGTSLEGLKAGVYIQNGKKVIINK